MRLAVFVFTMLLSNSLLAAFTLSANGDATGPVTVGVDEVVLLEVTALASDCTSGRGNNAAYRDTWTNAGAPEQQIFGSSPCADSPFGRTKRFDAPGTYTVSFVSEFCPNLKNNGNCPPGWREDGGDDITIVVTGPLTCFDDGFADTALSDDWVTAVSTGNFTPQVVNGRLRMTEAVSNQATAATLQREIPGADNLVILEFDYYAYGGSGADGLAVVLSDATITPRPGSYGGSLGYAQNSNGDAGFAGGWIGIGLDEFGNFSNPTEGRQGGVGSRPDAVTLRGSGTGQEGYRYLTHADASPGIDTTGPNSPHRYRITVDSRNAGAPEISVERDINGGDDYEFLIEPYPLDDPDQAPVPENFLLSLTGSTGGSTNIHELDNVELCALQLNPVGAQVDHFEILHDGVALTCAPETVTVRACANGDCSELFTDPVEATMSPAGWVGGDTVAISGGTTTARFQRTTAGTEVLGVAGSEPSTRPQSTTLCRIGGGGLAAANCALEFVDSGLVFDLPDLTSHRPSGPVEVRAVRRDDETQACVPAFENVTRPVDFWSAYVDPGPTGRPVSRALNIDGTDVGGAAGSVTSLALAFGPGGIAEVSLTYPDAGLLQLNGQYTGSAETEDEGLVMPGADQFVSAPAALCVTSAGGCAAGDASCSVFTEAGASFPLTITARGWQSDSDPDLCQGNPITPNFQLASIPLNSTVVAPAGGENGALSPAEYSHGPSGSAAETVGVRQSEVGVFQFAAAPPDNGYFGLTIPSVSSEPSGRFYPAYFEVNADAGALAASCGTGSAFTYTGQGFDWQVAPTLSIAAFSAQDTPTRNYIGAFQRLQTTGVTRDFPAADDEQAGTDGALLEVSNTTSPGELTETSPGVLRYSYSSDDLFTYTKTDASRVSGFEPTLSFVVEDIIDQDGVSANAAPYNLAPFVDFEIRYGHLALRNVYGPENGDALEMAFQAEVWNGARFILNSDDGCYGWTTTAITNTENFHDLQAASGTLSGGAGGPLLLEPNAGTGTDTLTWAVPSWLQDDWSDAGTLENPTGLATFGVYRGHDRVIYWRERR